jgi:hypothetical protein
MNDTITMYDGTVLPKAVQNEVGLDDYKGYYVVSPLSEDGYTYSFGRWEGGSSEIEMLKKNLIYLNKEDAQKVSTWILSQLNY